MKPGNVLANATDVRQLFIRGLKRSQALLVIEELAMRGRMNVCNLRESKLTFQST